MQDKENTSFIEVEYNIIPALFGKLDENVTVIEEHIPVRITQNDTSLEIMGNEKDREKATRVINNLIQLISKGEYIDRGRVLYVIHMLDDDDTQSMEKIISTAICVNFKGVPIRCKTAGQKRYVDAMKKNDIVFGIGPAGTGKTYLAMAQAVSAFKNKEIERIILTRPAVEAGEKLGFLPGDLKMKVDPYLRPLYDALNDLLGFETYTKLIEKEVIEIAPLAYMRGRTLNNAYIILDEAQNTTREQMKMLLTRIGTNSRAVINGDITQLDLPDGKQSGLIDASYVLKGIDGIEFVYLNASDVVRHELVMKIIKAYDVAQKKNEERRLKDKDK
ncbi:MAG: PhoH family protein [Clostridiales bacterium]|nr:PhoH family protein [Clostridiales bacterium]